MHGVTVKPYKNRKEAADALQSLGSASSPMKILLIEVNKNTFLSAKPDVQGWWDWIKSFLPSSAKGNEDSNTQPEKEFRPLQAFIGLKDAKDAPVENYRADISRLFTSINKLNDDDFKIASDEWAKNKDEKLNIHTIEGNIASKISSFKDTGSSQEIARLLTEPIANLKDLLSSGKKKDMVATWTNE